MGNGYRDVRSAGRDTVKGIWQGWLVGVTLCLVLAVWSRDVPVWGTATYLLLTVGGAGATVVAVVASVRVSRRVEKSRRGIIRD